MATTLTIVFFVLMNILGYSNALGKSSSPPIWAKGLDTSLATIDKAFEGTFGVYIEDLATKESYSYKANRSYYLASTIKIFVLIEISRLVDLNKLHWDDIITIRKGDYRDGPGTVNWLKPGKKVTIKKLADFMIQESDNTATDILMSIAGLENVEKTARRLGVHDLGPLTSMLDVRRIIFRQVHPLAGNLRAMDFINLWKTKDFSKKARFLAKFLEKPEDSFTAQDIKDSYLRFYALGYNSASLTTMGRLMKHLIEGTFASFEQRKEIVGRLWKCKTGKNRIKTNLPKSWKFAHKTGTQFRRTCDIGVAFGPTKEKITIAICVQDFKKRSAGDQQYGQIVKTFFRNYQKLAKVDKEKEELTKETAKKNSKKRKKETKKKDNGEATEGE